jgi:hypothetical protein
VAGNGNTFVVANGGSVTLVAGVKISILPGTQVQAGGYLHGYITTNGIYCGSSLNPLVANTISGDEPLAVPSFTKDQLIRVYPNPTADLFNVESARTGNSGTIQVDVFSLQGQRLMTRKIAGDSKHVFSLASYPVGMYVIQARSETQTEITRIVKY